VWEWEWQRAAASGKQPNEALRRWQAVVQTLLQAVLQALNQAVVAVVVAGGSVPASSN
jgi:hypothetical protein